MDARRHGQTREHHTGYTLIELVLVLAILGIATIAGIRGLQAYLDAIAVRVVGGRGAVLFGRPRQQQHPFSKVLRGSCAHRNCFLKRVW